MIMALVCISKLPSSQHSHRARVSLNALPGVVISGATTQGGRRRLLEAANPKHAALLKADMPYVVRAATCIFHNIPSTSWTRFAFLHLYVVH
jgi:hypothetical protein